MSLDAISFSPSSCLSGRENEQTKKFGEKGEIGMKIVNHKSFPLPHIKVKKAL